MQRLIGLLQHIPPGTPGKVRLGRLLMKTRLNLKRSL
jgi:hypothetical protein